MRVHGLGRWSGELTNDDEDDCCDANAKHGVPEYYLSFAGGIDGAGPVGTEGHPIRCGGGEGVSPPAWKPDAGRYLSHSLQALIHTGFLLL